MQLRSHRRSNRVVSSTATRIYQCLEWLLILGIGLQGLDVHSFSSWTTGLSSLLDVNRLWAHIGSWHIVLLVVLCIVATSFEGRSHWLSLTLYVVIFPQMIASRKCSTQVVYGTAACINRSMQISVVSFLQAFLQYYRPLGHWTPSSDQSIQYLGHILCEENPYIATLHLHILHLGRALVGKSLSLIELDLLCHAFTTFTLYYMTSINDETLTSMPETFFFAFLYGLLVALYPAIPIFKQNMRLARIKPQHRWKTLHKEQYKYAIYVYIIIAAVILTIVQWYLQVRLHENPFTLVVKYITDNPTRILLILYWAGTATLGVIVVIYFWGSKPVGGLSAFGRNARRLLRHATENDIHKTLDKQDVYFEEEGTAAKRARALDRRRKFFHGLVVVMFLPTMNSEPDLSYLALSLAFTAFLFEEVLRVTVLPPFGVAIHKFLSGFTDHRDKAGHLVVSHLFLLIGVAGPVWLTRTGRQAGSSADGGIAMLSGVLTLGAGDAAASIMGKKFGRHKWPSLNKSVEGTIAFILAMLMAGYVAKLFSSNIDMNWTTFTVGGLMTGMMEAVSTQNDNLITPVYMWCLVFQ